MNVLEWLTELIEEIVFSNFWPQCQTFDLYRNPICSIEMGEGAIQTKKAIFRVGMWFK